MLIPQKNKCKAWLFDWFIHRILKKHFKQVHFQFLSEVNSQQSMVVIANHHSWWDGFVLYYLNKKYFKKDFYLLMNEENYINFSWFKYMGAIGLPNLSKQIIDTISYIKSLLNNSDSAVYLFPQAKIFSQHLNELSLQKGWLKMCNSEQQIVFLHQFTDYFEHQKPSVFAYAELYDSQLSVLEAYQISYQKAKNKQSKIIK